MHKKVAHVPKKQAPKKTPKTTGKTTNKSRMDTILSEIAVVLGSKKAKNTSKN